jgi:plasmid stabilization system protein ParE
MGSDSKPVKWRGRARNSLRYLYDYISIDAPLNAGKYINRLIDFGDSLADFPSKFPLCRYEQFSENEFHCAVFEKNYVFVYKIKDQQVIIYNIVHVKRLA